MFFLLFYLFLFNWENIKFLDISSVEKVFQFNNIYLQTNDLKLKKTPHIIYITVERYTNNNNLKEYYDFHNKELNSFLKQNKFYVWNNQKANYPTSLLSSNSVLNMSYLEEMLAQLSLNNHPPVSAFYYILNNQVKKILRSHGYAYSFIHSEYNLVSYDENWINKKVWISSFLENRLLFKVFTEIIKVYVSNFPVRYLYDNTYYNLGLKKRCESIYNQKKYILDKLENQDQPLFLWWLFFFTHPPYIYSEDGSCLKTVNHSLESWNERKKDYLHNINIVNKLLIDFISNLKTKNNRPFIVLIQGDEGTANFNVDEVLFNKNSSIWTRPKKDLILKLGVFNAIYLPSKRYDNFHTYKSPINNFHIVFNEIFEDYKGKRLPDKYYLYENYYHILNLKEFK